MIIEGSRECGMLERMRSPIFVRPLTDAERQALTAGLRSPDAFVLRRCQILLASARGERAPRIAEQLGCDDQTVLEALGVPVWGLIWDNASWHVSRAVRTWIRTHNRAVKQQGHGVRLLVCCLPVKSPWLNPIEPKWVHSKRAIVEPTRLLSAQEVADRVCAYHRCPHEPHLSLPEPIQDKAS